MKIKTVLGIIGITILSIFSCNNTVNAEDSSATCIYYLGDTNKFQYNVNATSYSTSHSLKMQGVIINDEVTKSDFINDKNEFFCPKIYYTTSATGREMVYYIGRYKSDNMVLKPSDESKVNNQNNNTSNIQMCVYDEATFTVDTDKKEIVEYTASNCDQISNGYTYDQIYADGKCLLSSVNIVFTDDRNGHIVCALTPNTNIPGADHTETGEKYPNQENPDKYTGKVYCEIFGEKTWGYVKNIYTIIKILIPALIIVLGMIDFMKVLFSGEEKDMKSAGQRFLKRIIAGVIFILLPVLLQFLMGLFGFSEDCLQQLWRISL